VASFAKFIPRFDEHNRRRWRWLRAKLWIGICPGDLIADKGGHLLWTTTEPNISFGPRSWVPAVHRDLDKGQQTVCGSLRPDPLTSFRDEGERLGPAYRPKRIVVEGDSIVAIRYCRGEIGKAAGLCVVIVTGKEPAYDIHTRQALCHGGCSKLAQGACHGGRGPEGLSQLSHVDDHKEWFAVDLYVGRIDHVANPLVDGRRPVGRLGNEGRTINIKNRVLHTVAIRQIVSDLEGRVEILARVIDCSVEVPIEDEEIDAKVVGSGELLFDGTIGIILPTRYGLAILERTKRQAVEVEVGEWP